jgi:hypothetical protein
MPEILSKTEISHFVEEGFIRVDNAFSQQIAEAALDILWNDLPCDRSNSSTWTEPVIRLGFYSQPPFIESVNNEKLNLIFDQLIGEGKWIPCQSVGSFPVRFPSQQQAMDTGKHVDASFPGDDPNNYFEWRVNVKSKGRALLMLILYSDVSENDAPTIIYPGSHKDVAKMLWAEGDNGLSFMDLARKIDELTLGKVVYATGRAGTIYLCHPFMVHSAQSHRGTVPKFMAQPPLLLRGELSISENGINHSPVEEAIRLALG